MTFHRCPSFHRCHSPAEQSAMPHSPRHFFFRQTHPSHSPSPLPPPPPPPQCHHIFPPPGQKRHGYGILRFLKAIIETATTAFFLTLFVLTFLLSAETMLTPSALGLFIAALVVHGIHDPLPSSPLPPTCGGGHCSSPPPPPPTGMCPKRASEWNYPHPNDPCHPCERMHCLSTSSSSSSSSHMPSPTRWGISDGNGKWDGEGDVQHQSAPVQFDETPDHLTLYLDVPGFLNDEINATVLNGHEVVITGYRTNRIGNSFRVWEQCVLDPDVFLLDSVSAHLSDGVLEITIQKTSQSQPRDIPISTSRCVGKEHSSGFPETH